MRCDPRKLKNLREQMGLTQFTLAKKCNAGIRTIQRAEAGQSIGNETAGFIASVLEVPIIQLRAGNRADAEPMTDEDNLITLRPVRSGRDLIEVLQRSYMCRLDCDVEADGSNVETLKALVSILEERMPDPLSWEATHTFASLAERIDVTASLNERLRELDGLGMAVFTGSYSEKLQKPEVSPYDPPSVRPGTVPTPAVLTRIIIGSAAKDKVVIRKDYRWPIEIWDDKLPAWDADLDEEVPF